MTKAFNLKIQKKNKVILSKHKNEKKEQKPMKEKGGNYRENQ